MKHFVMAQCVWSTAACMQSLSPQTQQRPWEEGKKLPLHGARAARGGRGVGLEPQCRCLSAVKVEAEARRWEDAGAETRQEHWGQQARVPTAGHTRVWSRQGGREGEYRTGGWAWVRRTGGPGSRKLLAKVAVLAIYRVSVQTNFRNFYFKLGSPLPLPHIQKHALIHHLFKKIVSISSSASCDFFFFQLCQQKP